MKERPILMNGPMVRAILDGRKTQTRRIVKPQPGKFDEPWPNSQFHNCWHDIEAAPDYHGKCGNIPYVKGMRLWVKETACFQLCDKKKEKVIAFRADGTELPDSHVWSPSIFMPRWASRLTLDVAQVRVERVQDLSEEDAMAEGVGWPTKTRARVAFQRLWDSINGKKAPWHSNPWVWAITFKKL